MAGSDDKRKKLLYILQYLLENTDENNIAKTPDIIEHLENNYDIPVERKTIYTDIKLLQDYGEQNGLEIVYDPATKGYKVMQREFELDELQIIIDCIQATKFITQRKAKELTDKLKQLTSRHNRPTLDRPSFVSNRIRNMNERVFNGLDNIHAAIADDRKISFRYFNYDLQKEKEYNKKSYVASPYAILWNDGQCYLLAFEGGKMKHFRADRMDSVHILDKEKRDGKEEYKALRLSERSTKIFAMFGGVEERVTLRFSKHLTGVVIDRFGRDLMMIPDGDKHFTVTVNVEISPQFFGWLCGLGKGVRLVSPATVVEQLKEFIKGIAGLYEADTEI